jgi:curli biogenesis system outer membrane secretion channel CsgG
MIAKVCVLGMVLSAASSVVAMTDGVTGVQEKPRVAVIPFDNPTGWWGRQLGSSAADQLTVKLVNSGAFTVLERQRVDAIFDEWSLKEAGLVTPDKAAEIGKLLGVEYMITGRFVSFDITHRKVGGRVPGTRIGVGGSQTHATSALNARVISVTTGEIVAAMEGRSDHTIGTSGRAGAYNYSTVTRNTAWNPTLAETALAPAIDAMVADLVARRAQLQPSAQARTERLASRSPAIAGLAADGHVYIDQGVNAGIKIGQRFHVLRVVDEIRDADGNLLDRVTKRVGVLEVTQVLSQSSICRVIEGELEAKDLLESGS